MIIQCLFFVKSRRDYRCRIVEVLIGTECLVEKGPSLEQHAVRYAQFLPTLRANGTTKIRQ